MRVIFDLDNTLANTVGAVTAFYNQTSGQPPVSCDDQTVYQENLGPAWLDVVHRFYETPQHYVDTVEPYPGALDAVEASLAAGGSTKILSAYRKADTTPRKRLWLEKWRPSLIPILIGCRMGHKTRHQADVDINDHPGELYERWALDQRKTVVVDQPYNRTADMHRYATRRLVGIVPGRPVSTATQHLRGWGELTAQLNQWRKGHA